ncbi:MAG: hypothetical protein ACPGO3_14345 [Magnetospiraceae bacterium]
MMGRLFAGIVVAVLVVAGGAAPSQAQSLSAAGVEGFIDSMVEIRALAEKENDKAPMNTPKDMGNIMGAAAQHMRASRLAGQYQSIIQSHGFAGYEDWTQTATRVVNAYMAIKGGAEMAQAAQQMAAAKQQIMNNNSLSAEQKQQMMAQFDAMSGMVNAIAQVPPEDKAVVSPFVPRMDQVFN